MSTRSGIGSLAIAAGIGTSGGVIVGLATRLQSSETVSIISYAGAARREAWAFHWHNHVGPAVQLRICLNSGRGRGRAAGSAKAGIAVTWMTFFSFRRHDEAC